MTTEVKTLQRARGQANVAVKRRGDATRVQKLYQSGCAKVLLPRTHGQMPEAVFINTSGGLTGGDRIDLSFDAGRECRLAVTTQAAERIYRSTGGAASITASLKVGARAALDWLPQETILFDGASLRRRLNVELEPEAQIIALETLVFGRAAMGETLNSVSISDQWRIYRCGKLLHAEAIQLDRGLHAAREGRAGLQSARAIATVIQVAPDADSRLDLARGWLAREPGVLGAFSAKPDILIARFAASDAALLRKALIRFLMQLRGTTLPRVWSL